MQTDPPTPTPEKASSPHQRCIISTRRLPSPFSLPLSQMSFQPLLPRTGGCGRFPAEITPSPRGGAGPGPCSRTPNPAVFCGCRGARALPELSAPPLGVRGSGGSIPAGAGVGTPTPQRQRGSEVTSGGTAAAAGSKGAAPERLRPGCPAPRGRHGSGPCPKSRPQPGCLRYPGADKTHRQSLAENSIRGKINK